jgi:hypothetical protein
MIKAESGRLELFQSTDHITGNNMELTEYGVTPYGNDIWYVFGLNNIYKQMHQGG